ncbi:MAG: endonuclease/exonuclease/phosphatase family protein, partial [Pseudomonadota bacterium]
TYLDRLIEANQDERVIVTGDWNDGPGPDFFERQYLTHNVADIVLGSTFYPDLIFRHPILERVPSTSLFTSRFDDFVDGIDDRPLLLDHFAVSPALANVVVDATIEHDAFEAELEDGGPTRAKRPSDHRPIWLQI